jgi:hypothetical protein
MTKDEQLKLAVSLLKECLNMVDDVAFEYSDNVYDYPVVQNVRSFLDAIDGDE